MTNTADITVSKEVLDWTDFDVVGDDDIADGAAEAGGTITYSYTRAGSNYTASIVVQHNARVEGDTTQTSSLLRHEQGHLDLAILVARRMKFDIEHGMSPQNAAARHITHRLPSANVRYDQLTNHGLNAAVQSAWETALDQALLADSPPSTVRTVSI